MVASSLERQQKEKYLHFFPSKERIGKEQFSQDTPLFSWQQELDCWDCLQSHVTNTPASPVWSPYCKYCFSQKSQCSLALFCGHQTPSVPYPYKSAGTFCSTGPQKLKSEVVRAGICLEFAEPKSSSSCTYIALLHPPLSWMLFCTSEKIIISINSTDLFFCSTSESETSGVNYDFLKMQPGFRQTVFSDTASHCF